MPQADRLALGLDFGTESVRALLVDLTGQERGAAVTAYPHGQIIDRLPATGEMLPAEFALQHPGDWLASAGRSVKAALKKAGASADQVIGIGVDFTSCTMLPALADGTPLCFTERFRGEKYAWPKLWKHHGAVAETERINRLAAERNEIWLPRYGGTIGLEWFFPKIYESLRNAPQAYEATEVWLEAGDWFVWQLVGGTASDLPRSTCQAGYKAMWNAAKGYPSREFFRALDRRMEKVVLEKMPGRMLSPGEAAGAVPHGPNGRVAIVPIDQDMPTLADAEAEERHVGQFLLGHEPQLHRPAADHHGRDVPPGAVIGHDDVRRAGRHFLLAARADFQADQKDHGTHVLDRDPVDARAATIEQRKNEERGAQDDQHEETEHPDDQGPDQSHGAIVRCAAALSPVRQSWPRHRPPTSGVRPVLPPRA